MEEQHINFVEQNTEEPRDKNTKWRLGIFLFITVLLISGFILYSRTKTELPADPGAYDPVTLEPKKPEGFLKKISYFVFKKGNETLEGQKDDQINILLLGMGGPGHDGPFLSDTIIIASLKPSSKQIALVSVPRDLGVNIPGYGFTKINHANAYGENQKKDWGGAYAAEIIADTLDIEIPYYVRIDFKAFEEIIDEIDGVTVEVERSFTDALYPAPDDEYQTLYFKSGVQTMNGSTALKFARSRHGNNGEGSDFARAKRQQKILLALKEKLLSFGTLANPVRIKRVMDSLERHVTTNMEFPEILSFIKLAREFNTKNITSLVLDNSENGFLRESISLEGVYLLEPKTGSFEQIHEAITHIFDKEYVATDTSPAQKEPKQGDANVEIINATWRAGLAARVRKRLSDKNFIISSIGNAQEKPVTKSGIYRVTKKEVQDTVLALQQELNIPIIERLPAIIAPTSSTDILVLLGDDFPEE
ncbi:MAG: LCP family protein [Candidatus Magasanikbacteria bacterium]|nr:LCP family protein [Candidatus Magasanikbacteria bacterium]